MSDAFQTPDLDEGFNVFDITQAMKANVDALRSSAPVSPERQAEVLAWVQQAMAAVLADGATQEHVLVILSPQMPHAYGPMSATEALERQRNLRATPGPMSDVIIAPLYPNDWNGEVT